MIKRGLGAGSNALLMDYPSPAGRRRIIRRRLSLLLAVLLAASPIALPQTSTAQNDAALYNEVQQALEQGNYDRAIEIYRQLIRREGNSASLLLGLGVAEYQKGDYNSAVESLHACLRLQPHAALAEA